MFALRLVALTLACAWLGAMPASAASGFEALTDEFVYSSLALSPVTATSQGYHRHQGVSLDENLDDYSAAGLARSLAFYRSWSARLDRLDVSGLDAEQQADLEIIRNTVGGALIDLQQLHSERHNPTVYVELIGNALFNPYVLDYAPLEQRFGHIIERLKQIPRLITQARANLTDAPPVWTRVAQEEDAGNIDLIDRELRAQVPPGQRVSYAAAAGKALVALRSFDTFLARTLSQHPRDWRLGPQAYRDKCGYELALGRTPDELLAAAEADLQALRQQMAQLAAPQSVAEALARVADAHATPATYMAEARRTLEQATAFVHERGLVALPSGHNLEVIDTPVFERGIYSVGGFNAAPALEPQLGAFYWVTPIPSDWPRERVESKLREYNHDGLQQLTIHEAMPGHYVQFDHAGRIEPAARRVLRSVYGNGPYIEGWAVYAQQMMTDEGYLQGEPGLRLMLLKQLMRATVNTILDVRLHTMGMTEQQAIDLMVQQSYQEPEEARAKVQRAQLSSCQLATYYAGWKGWLEIRAQYRRRHAGDYSLAAFHEAALREGAVSLPLLARLLR